MTSLADISLGDGTIRREEFKLLCQIGNKFDYSQYDIKSLLKRRKKKLMHDAKQHLRSSK